MSLENWVWKTMLSQATADVKLNNLARTGKMSISMLFTPPHQYLLQNVSSDDHR
jgi:hypothetical protein